MKKSRRIFFKSIKTITYWMTLVTRDSVHELS